MSYWLWGTRDIIMEYGFERLSVGQLVSLKLKAWDTGGLILRLESLITRVLLRPSLVKERIAIASWIGTSISNHI